MLVSAAERSGSWKDEKRGLEWNSTIMTNKIEVDVLSESSD